MKGVLASFLGTLVMACGGCGGGGGGGSTSSDQVVAKPIVSVAIDMEGDSLIWGYVGSDANGKYIQSTNNPPAVVQGLLQAQFGTTVTTQNTAIAGARVIQSLGGTSPYTVPFATRLASNTAQITLSDYSVNDSNGTDIDAYKADMVRWVADVRAAGKTPVLEEPNPVCSATATNVPAFRAALVSVAQSQNVLLITQYDYILSLPNWQSMLQSDCVHPTDALYKIKAQREADALGPLVKSMAAN